MCYSAWNKPVANGRKNNKLTDVEKAYQAEVIKNFMEKGTSVLKSVWFVIRVIIRNRTSLTSLTVKKAFFKWLYFGLRGAVLDGCNFYFTFHFIFGNAHQK